MAQRTGITKAAMIAAGPDGEPKPEVDPAYRPSQIDGVNVEGVDVEGYINPTVSRTKRKTQAVIIPEREDEEADDGANLVFFVPPKHEAVSYSVEAVLDSKQVGRKVLYLVKWEGFDGKEDNTWEPQKNLDDCPEKLEAYWKASPESAGARQHNEELQLKSKPKGGASASSSSPTSVPKELEAAAGPRTLTKRAGKEAATPVTASGPAKKKARVDEAGPSSAAAGRPSRAAASAANDKMDTLIKAGSSGIMVD